MVLKALVGEFNDHGPNAAIAGFNKLSVDVTSMTLTYHTPEGVAFAQLHCGCGGTWAKDVPRTILPYNCPAGSCDTLVLKHMYTSYRYNVMRGDASLTGVTAELFLMR